MERFVTLSTPPFLSSNYVVLQRTLYFRPPSGPSVPGRWWFDRDKVGLGRSKTGLATNARRPPSDAGPVREVLVTVVVDGGRCMSAVRVQSSGGVSPGRHLALLETGLVVPVDHDHVAGPLTVAEGG